ncbi:MAG: type III pantothenate kinase [Paracoccaceae bacterium]|nr:MAG: type III pantothenate kinase [Alphaproteobacteria bacterium]GIX14844.1 MAG: type III pantothenate kinase [Paracoccaceae bacterium]
MLLCIDVGNTNTLFGLHDGKGFVGQWRCATSPQRTADEYFVWLDALRRHAGLGDRPVTDVIVSSVVPQVLFNLRVLSDRYFATRPLIVGREGCALGVPVRVDPGTNVGADRLVNTVGAHDRYGGDLIVVDFGTATTFDVVGSDGAYEGGVIAPGVNLSVAALHQAAAALPLIDVARPERVVGTNTLACMQSGVYWGYVGLIEGICARIAAERGRPMRVVGTGGLSSLFARGTDVIEVIDPDITMHGLVCIHRTNRGKRNA